MYAIDPFVANDTESFDKAVHSATEYKVRLKKAALLAGDKEVTAQMAEAFADMTTATAFDFDVFCAAVIEQTITGKPSELLANLVNKVIATECESEAIKDVEAGDDQNFVIPERPPVPWNYLPANP